MAHYVISPAAHRDIRSILAWTHERFGQQGRLRYEALLVRAILDLAEDPERTGSQTRSEIAAAARTYHLWHSRDRVEPATDRVRRPRHFLLYRTCEDGRVEIGRVLHDRMDLARHLPDDYGREATGEQTPESP
jgi:toxin ParE1/3/4